MAYFIDSSQSISEIGTITIVTLHMRELRLTGVKLVQDHTSSERQSWDENLGLTPKPSLITRMLYYFPCSRKL